MAMHMPANNFHPFARDADQYHSTTLNANVALEEAASAAAAATATDGYMASPAPVFHDHLRPSNLRAAEGENDTTPNDIQSRPTSPLAVANLPMLASAVASNTQHNDKFGFMESFNHGSFGDPDPVSAVSEMSLNLEEMKGYAQLVFPDGEYLVTSTEIMLGRDERAQQILKEQEKRQRKILREQALRQAREHAAEADARAALERYKLEPGTGSDGERRPSSSSLLEGRPAPGLASTFSETGGIVNYDGSVDGVRRKKARRGHPLLSRSSSNSNSVAPASLHVYGAAAPRSGNEDEKCIFLPIHPFQIEDIRKISKEHLRIFYDSIEKHWKMEIKGNGAFVLNELYKETITDPSSGTQDITPRHFKRGDTVILTHNSEVLVTSLTFLFKLPQRRGFSTFDSDVEDDLETSPTQQRTEDFETERAASELSVKLKQETGENEDSLPTKRPKIVLKASKPKPAVVIEEEEASPEPPPRPTGGLGKKKPSDAVKTVEEELEAQLAAQTTPTPTVPPVFDPNSTLTNVPVDELPEKRKGPGRPPKNGLVSKRDEGIIRRKMKEYEKRGERPPPYKDILAIVRAENRAKELAARAAARGEPMPQSSLDALSAIPTTELDQNDIMEGLDPELALSTEPVPARTTSQELDNAEIMKNVTQQQRTYKSPSPMKPKEEYTEEQLKRPTQTYYYILDEILTEGPEDAMELQQIYDKICKKYPFYKYVVESTGWQSSVRHNLKQNDRFKPVSKQGKGWLWAIDPAVPLDKEKKKKPTPPPMSRPPMQYQTQNGAMQQGMPYNGNTYQTQYGQSYTTAQPQYTSNTQQTASPYTTSYQSQHYNGVGAQAALPVATQPAVPPGLVQAQPQQPAVPRNLSHPPSRPTSHTPQPAAPPPGVPPAFQNLVEEIMRFRVEYLSPFGKDANEYARHERIFKRCVEWISQLNMRQNPEVKFENEEERRVFQILEKMRHKFEHGTTPVQPKITQDRPPATTSAQAATIHTDNAVPVHVTNLATGHISNAPGHVSTASQGQSSTSIGQGHTFQGQANVSATIQGQGSASTTSQGQDNVLQSQNNALQRQSNASQGQSNAVQGQNNALQGQNNALQGRNNALQGQVNALQEQPGNIMSQPTIGQAGWTTTNNGLQTQPITTAASIMPLTAATQNPVSTTAMLSSRQDGESQRPNVIPPASTSTPGITAISSATPTTTMQDQIRSSGSSSTAPLAMTGPKSTMTTGAHTMPIEHVNTSQSATSQLIPAMSNVTSPHVSTSAQESAQQPLSASNQPSAQSFDRPDMQPNTSMSTVRPVRSIDSSNNPVLLNTADISGDAQGAQIGDDAQAQPTQGVKRAASVEGDNSMPDEKRVKL